MTEPIVLPPGVALGILAFLLSLLPAGLFIWVWYLRRHDRPVPIAMVAAGFFGGMALVWPAFRLERLAPVIWAKISPGTVHYFDGAILPLQSPYDIILPAVGTFFIVSLVEEGLRFLALFGWFRLNHHIDQIFDGLVVGLAAGLGFATLENTLYFFQLFSSGSFNTLVFVFFLRFMISTLAHISFGGIMGVFLARGLFSIYRPGLFYAQAFFIPWFFHGVYDWLLGIDQTLYAVLALLPLIILLFVWIERRDFYVLNRDTNGAITPQQRSPQRDEALAEKNSWNRFAPWLVSKKSKPSLTKSI